VIPRPRARGARGREYEKSRGGEREGAGGKNTVTAPISEPNSRALACSRAICTHHMSQRPCVPSRPALRAHTHTHARATRTAGSHRRLMHLVLLLLAAEARVQHVDIFLETGLLVHALRGVTSRVSTCEPAARRVRRSRCKRSARTVQSNGKHLTRSVVLRKLRWSPRAVRSAAVLCSGVRADMLLARFVSSVGCDPGEPRYCQIFDFFIIFLIFFSKIRIHAKESFI